MEFTEFNLKHCKELIKEKVETIGNKKIVVNDYSDSIKYLQKYFYTLDDGDIAFRDKENSFKIFDSVTASKVYFNRLPKDISKWFFVENDNIYKPVCDPQKEIIGESEINYFKGFKHKRKPFHEFSEEIKNKVDTFNKYVLEILCSDNKEMFDYLMKWSAHMIKGKKNDSLLYLKGPEGIGKSTFSDFLNEHVLGKQICCKSNSSPLSGSYNKILQGKLLVVFEELPTFSTSQWMGISSKLKDMIGSNKIVYSEKYEKDCELENLNNYIINTNVDAIQHSDGRRYCILDVSTKRMQDHEYFGDLKECCFNDEVGAAYFNFLLSIDTTNFNSQQHMPVTKGKLNVKADLLCLEFKFLKDEYILKKIGVERMKSQQFYNLYVAYCERLGKFPLSIIKFASKLEEINIRHTSSNGYRWYKITHEFLNSVAEKNHWIHELDVYQDVKENIKSNHLDDGIDKKYDKLYQEMIKVAEMNCALTKRIDELLMKEHKKILGKNKDKSLTQSVSLCLNLFD